MIYGENSTSSLFVNDRKGRGDILGYKHTKLKAYNIDLYPLLALYFTHLYKTTEILTSIYEAYILSGICI